jgi:hypothetical protein
MTAGWIWESVEYGVDAKCQWLFALAITLPLRYPHRFRPEHRPEQLQRLAGFVERNALRQSDLPGLIYLVQEPGYQVLGMVRRGGMRDSEPLQPQCR